ncbi:universal stress protein [Nitratireductor sp. CAU 1489]|uniref:Universal stress protein n=1 Tax=Nitratireductor arenosus TaxID=2682096 RepID=A0A844QEY5_9HYPH|nr:universal stress protein [Nitratireductor arenosus]MVA97845.1 universal stress protein [Nitratireductor arenosus]
MYDTILVPVDLADSGKAPAMIAAARKMANDGARIVLVHIVQDIPTFVAAELPGGVMEKTQNEARKTLEAMASEYGAGIEVDVGIGQPASGILAVAKERQADVIVIASHKPGLQDYLLGSTAGRVVRHATCSVHVMR